MVQEFEGTAALLPTALVRSEGFLLILISHREVDQKRLVSEMYIRRIALMLMAIPATAFFSSTAIHIWNSEMNSKTLITFLT
ncbi:hypothetical protein [Diaphorobacter sp.]|uniref:hypothetical protein n=1 Tax=Diaphorobacter sp. TaxID=1934310 RepID=UPI0028A05597|nr:hypothetical protein [Diaphorobacter sp.]